MALHRWLTALPEFRKGLNLVIAGGYTHARHVLNWPGSDTPIEETRAGKLKVCCVVVLANFSHGTVVCAVLPWKPLSVQGQTSFRLHEVSSFCSAADKICGAVQMPKTSFKLLYVFVRPMPLGAPDGTWRLPSSCSIPSHNPSRLTYTNKSGHEKSY